MNERELITFDTKDIKINQIELANRLNTPAGFENETLQRCICEVTKSAHPMFCFRKAEIKVADGIIDFGFCKVMSKDLAKNLLGCCEAVVMAATLGIDIDRLIARGSVISKAEGFFLDAVASSFAEAVIDYANDRLKQEFPLRPRFSAGYGDWELSCQKDILDFLCADKLMGIKIGDNLIMTPRKSITAVCGIGEKI